MKHIRRIVVWVGDRWVPAVMLPDGRRVVAGIAPSRDTWDREPKP